MRNQAGSTAILCLAARSHRGVGRAAVVLCAIVYLVAASEIRAADPETAKRVLIVHSFGSSAPPFTTHSTAFETTLTEQLGKKVDLDEVSLDMARYAQPDLEEP